MNADVSKALTKTLFVNKLFFLFLLMFAFANIAYAAAPVAIDQNLGVLRRGQAVTVTLSYTDPDGVAPYTFEITRNPTKGTVVPVGVGQYRYTASQTQSGRDTFQWRVKDAGGQWSNRAVVSIEINEPPIAKNQSVILNQDTSQNIFVEFDDDFYPQIADTSIVRPAEHGTVVKLERKKFLYTPVAGYFGPDSFQWKANDGLADGNTATVSITVNQKPIGHEQAILTGRDASVEFTLDYEDDGVPGPYKVKITNQVDNGTLTELGLARYRYTPKAGYAGSDRLDWQINDGLATSTFAIARITVAEAGQLGVRPQRLNFYRSVGDSDVSAVITITNNSGSPMNWSIRPGQSQVFRRLPEQGGILDAGESEDVTIRVPISSLKKGVYEGSLEIVSPEAENSPQTIHALLRVDEGKSVRLGISAPGFGPDGKTERTIAHLEELGASYLRLGLKWTDIEPSKGNFQWGFLEDQIEWGYQNDWKILLLIPTECPSWVSGVRTEKGCVPNPEYMDDYREFVAISMQKLKELSLGYPNGLPVKSIQFANEWNNEGNGRYPGPAETFVGQLSITYDEIKKVFPDMPVVLGGFVMQTMKDFSVCLRGINPWGFGPKYCAEPYRVAWLLRTKYVVDNGKYDQVDQHLYFDWQHWPLYVETLREVVLPPAKKNIPVIASEFGGPETYDGFRDFDDAFHAEEVANYIKALRKTNITEAYYFSLGEPTPDSGLVLTESGLIERTDGSRKPGYFVFQDLNLQVALQLQDPEDKANEGLFGNVWAFFLGSDLVASLGDLLYNLFPSVFQKN